MPSGCLACFPLWDKEMLKLTKRQTELMLKYTAPLPDEMEAMEKSLENKRRRVHSFDFDRFTLDMLMADLVHYSKEINSRSLLEELDELYDMLESETIDTEGMIVLR